MENSQPATYPTTSDISMFMRSLGFKWSNDAQIYYHDNMNRYEHLSRNTAERLYKHFIGDKPFPHSALIE
jgi:hypothetical protein